MSVRLTLTVVLFAFTLSSYAWTADMPVQEGQPAPEFELPGTDGKTHKLSDYRGKKAVVVAWFPKAATRG